MFVSVSPNAMNVIYQATVDNYSKLKLEIKELFKKFMDCKETHDLKKAIAMDEPL